jgi:hypothetical protein
MAKKASLKNNNPLAKTSAPTPTAQVSPPKPTEAPQPTLTDGDDNGVIAVGVALRKSELRYVKQYAEEHGVTGGSLLTALMRYALKDFADGKFKPVKKGLKIVSVDPQKS